MPAARVAAVNIGFMEVTQEPAGRLWNRFRLWVNFFLLRGLARTWLRNKLGQSQRSGDRHVADLSPGLSGWVAQLVGRWRA